MIGRLLQAASIIPILAAWTIVSLAVGEDVLPPPWTVAENVWGKISDGSFAGPLFGSLGRTILGFIGAMVLGIAYGIAAARSKRFDDYTTGVFHVLLFAPTLVIVFAGLLIFGYSATWVVVMITAVAVAPNTGVYIRDVMRHVDGDILGMSDSFHVTGRRRILDVYIPYLTPPLLSSSRIALNSSWKVVLLCEIFGFPGGLGYNIRIDYGAYAIPSMLAWVALFVLTLMIIEQFIRTFEHLAVRWA